MRANLVKGIDRQTTTRKSIQAKMEFMSIDEQRWITTGGEEEREREKKNKGVVIVILHVKRAALKCRQHYTTISRYHQHIGRILLI